MNKKLLVIIASILSRSGYGTHSRAIIRSILSIPEITSEYSIKILSTKWGGTPLSALDPNEPEDKVLLDLIVPNIQEQPDVSIQISIPSEFQKIGRFSIGITAGTEGTIAPLNFVQGCNNVDLVITPSQFTKDILLGTKYDKKNQQGRIEHTIQVDKPFEVLFEGLDLKIFNKENYSKEFPIVQQINQIKESFAFLVCGHWIGGSFTHDRKDISGTVYTFLNTFKNKKNRAALILKVSGAGFSYPERDQIIAKINDIQNMIREEGFSGKLPNVYLINGDLSDDEMNTLYNHPKVKAMVSFSHGEGFGLPLLEFSTTGKPIISSGYSGQMDFLNPEYSVLLPGELKNIHPSAANEWLPKEGQWFYVNYNFAGQVLNDVFENYDKYLERSRKTVKYSRDNFSLTKMVEKFLEIWKKYVIIVDNKPKQIKLNLPQLKKIT